MTTPIDHKIEFMAWDTKALCLMDVVTIDYDQQSVTLRDDESFYNEWIKNIVLMQLTALRSINDKPIYNHMIVKGESSTLYEIDMFDYAKMTLLSNMNLEIVGNRFQNHELLEMCK